jgi:lipooligosaccharide transport system permease protein
VLPVIALTGLLFSALGISFSLRLATIDFFSFYFTLFLTPLFLFSGVFFPLEERLSPFWQKVAEALPLLHPVRLARTAFRGDVSPALIAWDVGYILVLSAVLLAFARQAARRRLTT